MAILITGGAGFIASNIVDKLLELGKEVVVVDNLSSGKKENLNEKVKLYPLDISSEDLNHVFQKEHIEYVIHHAAQINVQNSLKDPMSDAKTNIVGTLNILENCRKHNIKKLIYASSAAVYGNPITLGITEEHPVNPISPYGISKHTPEHYIQMYGELYNLKYTILRYSNVYGPRQDPVGEGGVISIFIDSMIRGQTSIIYGDGKQTRDFIYVKDIVAANIKALEFGDNQILNISSNIPVSINYLFEIINKLLNLNLAPIYKPGRKGDIKHSYLNNSKAKRILKWEPRFSLIQGIIETLIYYNQDLLHLKEIAAMDNSSLRCNSGSE